MAVATSVVFVGLGLVVLAEVALLVYRTLVSVDRVVTRKIISVIAVDLEVDLEVVVLVECLGRDNTAVVAAAAVAVAARLALITSANVVAVVQFKTTLATVVAAVVLVDALAEYLGLVKVAEAEADAVVVEDHRAFLIRASAHRIVLFKTIIAFHNLVAPAVLVVVVVAVYLVHSAYQTVAHVVLVIIKLEVVVSDEVRNCLIILTDTELFYIFFREETRRSNSENVRRYCSSK